MAKHRKAAAPATTTEAAPAANVVQDQGAAGDTGSVESTDATTTTEAAPAANVVQDQGAAGDTGSVESTDAVESTAPGPKFPRDVVIRNHGHLAVCEPATRAYVCAGGSSAVVVQSNEQALMLLSNIKSMHFGDKIQVSGLDDIVFPDEESEVTE